MPKILIVLAALPLLLIGALASADYAIVDVREKGPDGHRFIVPVPLAAARLALAFAPSEAQTVEIPPEAARYLSESGRLLESLSALPDCVLVAVEHGEERVQVRKSGDDLRIDVRSSKQEMVSVRVPLAAARQVLAGIKSNRLHTSNVVAALGKSHGEMVHFNDDHTEVRLRVW